MPAVKAAATAACCFRSGEVDRHVEVLAVVTEAVDAVLARLLDDADLLVLLTMPVLLLSLLPLLLELLQAVTFPSTSEKIDPDEASRVRELELLAERCERMFVIEFILANDT